MLTTVILNGGTGNPFSDSPCTSYHNAFESCALNQQSVDDILVAINTANTSNGTLNMHGGTSSPPSTAGVLSKWDLQSRGWTVSHNGAEEFIIGATDIGFVYNPSRLDSLYQDSAGRTPAAEGDVLGMVLDVSKGMELGPELWDGTLTAGSEGAYNATTGELSCVITTGLTYSPNFSGPTLVAKTFYKVTVKLSGNLSKITSITLTGSSSTDGFSTGGVAGTAILAAGGEYSWIGARFGTGTNPKFTIWTDGTTTWDGLFLESISVREIKGYHAAQPTTLNKPTLAKNAAGRYYVSMDGIDDSVTAYFATPPGASKLLLVGADGVMTISDVNVSTNSLDLTTSFQFASLVNRDFTSAEINGLLQARPDWSYTA